MDHDDDVEHLFSWLQTPELRYREFAGAREITDAVLVLQARESTRAAVAAETPAPGNTQLDEEYPADQFPDQVAVRVETEPEPQPQPAPSVHRPASPVYQAPPPEPLPVRHGPAMIAPMPMTANEPLPPTNGAQPFALGAEGRDSSRTQPAEWAGPRSPSYAPVSRQAPLPPVPAPPQPSAPNEPQATAPVEPPPPEPTPHAAVVAPPQPAATPAAGGGLLGGAYRENGSNGERNNTGNAAQPSPPPDTEKRQGQSLDAVFGRLSGRHRLPDPRDRLRHIPGLGPQQGRQR